ncbi:1-acylglycerol-3-phosphate O-acyltransferase [Bacteroidales bacterium Barb4]|nr:1-acylglycerol-3-phosphate O-acyltransferase [Bacteroidales bacterium Barb4]
MSERKIGAGSRWLAKKIFRAAGWKYGSLAGVELPKCVICVAPHTSNWDFIVGKIFYTSIGCNAHFLIKKEWFFFPVGLLLNYMGGVPVDRRKAALVTEQMVEEFNKRNIFQVAITPEGTRKPVKEWKKGFYHIAKVAEVPVLLIYMDYAKKEIGTLGVFHPTGDIIKDMKNIRSYYKNVSGRNPENFISVV